MSQESLAFAAGVEVGQIAEIERGVAEPTLVMLFQLAGALDLEPSRLIARMERELC
jgi:transcriptional regulator with XRE-family HTH domain